MTDYIRLHIYLTCLAGKEKRTDNHDSQWGRNEDNNQHNKYQQKVKHFPCCKCITVNLFSPDGWKFASEEIRGKEERSGKTSSLQISPFRDGQDGWEGGLWIDFWLHQLRYLLPQHIKKEEEGVAYTGAMDEADGESESTLQNALPKERENIRFSPFRWGRGKVDRKNVKWRSMNSPSLLSLHQPHPPLLSPFHFTCFFFPVSFPFFIPSSLLLLDPCKNAYVYVMYENKSAQANHINAACEWRISRSERDAMQSMLHLWMLKGERKNQDRDVEWRRTREKDEDEETCST